MNLSFFIARKYFFAQRNRLFIHIISSLAILVVAFFTGALIIILSVFNGMEGILKNLYGQFDPHITISPVEGKSFVPTKDMIQSINETSGVSSITEIIEDNALIKYRGAERIVRLKGVSQEFNIKRRFSDAIKYGELKLIEDNTGYAMIGNGIRNDLGIDLYDDFYPLQVYYPNDIKPGQINPEKMFNVRHILAGSAFGIENYIDEHFVFVPIEFSISLLNYGNKRTSLEVEVMDEETILPVANNLQKKMGEEFNVRTSNEIHSSLYRILKWEKIFIFIAISVILLIGSINIYFALSMLVLDKKKDLTLLHSLGIESKTFIRIFLIEGALIAFSGAIIGLIFGLLITFIQQQYGIVSMGIDGALSDAYPVKIEFLDIINTALTVCIITFLASIQPAIRAAKSSDMNLLH